MQPLLQIAVFCCDYLEYCRTLCAIDHIMSASFVRFELFLNGPYRTYIYNKIQNGASFCMAVLLEDCSPS